MTFLTILYLGVATLSPKLPTVTLEAEAQMTWACMLCTAYAYKILSTWLMDWFLKHTEPQTPKPTTVAFGADSDNGKADAQMKWRHM